MKKIFFILLAMFLLTACADDKKETVEDTEKSGEVKVVEDVWTQYQIDGKVRKVEDGYIFIETTIEELVFEYEETYDVEPNDYLLITYKENQNGLKEVVDILVWDSNMIDDSINNSDGDQEQQKIKNATGMFIGLVDSKSVEIEMNSQANVYVFGPELKEKLNNIEWEAIVDFTYVENQNNQLMLLSIKER